MSRWWSHLTQLSSNESMAATGTTQAGCGKAVVGLLALLAHAELHSSPFSTHHHSTTLRPSQNINMHGMHGFPPRISRARPGRPERVCAA